MAEVGSADLPRRIAELEQRIADLERRERHERRAAGLLRELVPPEVRTHLRAAQREQLMAVRSFIDHWIGRIERTDRSNARESIPVD